MKNEYFNLIGQKSVNGKMVLIAVVPDDIFGDNLPSIFEVQAVDLYTKLMDMKNYQTKA